MMLNQIQNTINIIKSRCCCLLHLLIFPFVSDSQSPDLINFGENNSDDEVVVVKSEENLIKKFEEIDLINFDEEDDIIGSDNNSRDDDEDSESCHDVESDYDDEENYKDKLKRLSLEGYDPNAERIRQISMTHNSKAPIQIHVLFANATKNV